MLQKCKKPPTKLRNHVLRASLFNVGKILRHFDPNHPFVDNFIFTLYGNRVKQSPYYP